jgi:hypothetical protein
MLRDLPVAIILTKRDHGRYAWQFLQGCGVAPTYLEAVKEALMYLQGAKMTE